MSKHKASRKERRRTRNEWRANEARVLMAYARVAGANIPDYEWDNWLGPCVGLTYMRRQALEVIVELAILGDRMAVTPNPRDWPNLAFLQHRLEIRRAEKHPQP